MLNNNPKLDAYLEWIETRIQEDFEPYLLTFMFNPLNGSEAAVRAQMEHEVKRIYSRLLTRIVKKPNKTPVDQMPLLIGCVDWPVPKLLKASLKDVSLNGGMHMHALMLVPPTSRSPLLMSQLIELKYSTFVTPGGVLMRLHAVLIKDNQAQTAAYALKSVQRGRLGDDDILILPRSHSEM
ncbi:hypothetical protein [Rhizobium tumorigenes]|uniref:Uncharacterized protein n=1 Tax=Rhizobium tumorigenes TaxID=2041385 RepID=A0AAF1KI50_9HYPH|nr:hypothetical protein [Rhizobium tumorigenes]WFR95715.1 hypothetical protein PR017_00760 [Rhizobium tumorigenes]